MGYDLRPIKRFVRDHYPEGHSLRIILLENDWIDDPKELLGKVEVWLHLSHQ